MRQLGLRATRLVYPLEALARDEIAEVRVTIAESDAELEAGQPYHIAVYFVVDETTWNTDPDGRGAIHAAFGRFVGDDAIAVAIVRHIGGFDLGFVAQHGKAGTLILGVLLVGVSAHLQPEAPARLGGEVGLRSLGRCVEDGKDALVASEASLPSRPQPVCTSSKISSSPQPALTPALTCRSPRASPTCAPQYSHCVSASHR